MEPTPPKYPQTCQRAGCQGPASHALVVHAWEHKHPKLFRTIQNSTKLFPEVAACDEHKLSLVEIGQHFLQRGLPHMYQHFISLGKGVPDLGDVLLQAHTTDEALLLWRDEPQEAKPN